MLMFEGRQRLAVSEELFQAMAPIKANLAEALDIYIKTDLSTVEISQKNYLPKQSGLIAIEREA